MAFLSGKQAFLEILKQEGVEVMAMDLVNPAIDYVGLARSLGVPGELVEKTADAAPALKRGLASGGPYLIDARIDGTFKG